MSHSEFGTLTWDWLCALRLEQYSKAFSDAGLSTLGECQNLTQEQLERMGISLPGHQRRILASLHKSHLQLHPDAPPDTNSAHPPTERAEYAEQWEQGHPSVHGERPVAIPGLERPVPKARERREPEARETTPMPRERQKLIPKLKGGGGGGEEKGNLVLRERKVEEKDREVDGDRGRPVPKERTKHRSTHPGDLRPEPSLPPIPPRSTPNCPPQRFTPSPNPSSPLSTCAAAELGSPSPQAPVLPSRGLGPSPTSTPSPAQSSLHPPSSLPVPFPYPRSEKTSLPPSARQKGIERQRKTLPVSPTVPCSLSPSVASPSSPVESREDGTAPPLPLKVSARPSQAWRRQRQVVRPPTTLLSQSLAFSGTATDETQMELAPPVLPEIRTSQNQEDPAQSKPAQPALPARRINKPPPKIRSGSDEDNSDDVESLNSALPLANTLEKDMLLPVPRLRKGRYNSLYSDDELLGDDETFTNHRDSWQDYGPISPQGSVYLPITGRIAAPTKPDQCAVIKMGWLDKNPPQGALYYQRRWVKLDVDYLRYFDNEKEVYSKRIISTAFITDVLCVGELKFEVVTNNRNFLFRAENEAERGCWMDVLLDCTRGRQCNSLLNPCSPLTPNHQGYLELRGLRSKLFTVVASDKVFLYKSLEDYRIGVGITSIDMNVGNVKDTDRRSFDLTTPYRTFSFLAESEQLREQWVEAMRDAIGEALSNSEVAERVWTEPSNGSCADCGAARPEWASINLCVVVCKRCAGEHRGLGPSISKVRSLKMDRKVWTEELIQVFLSLGNQRVNTFWAANVPPSEALSPVSCSDDRRQFISNKYRQGKYRKYHPLYGNQKELNNALCINVQCSDVLETLSLLFCGADVNCSTGMADGPSPLALANARSQPLQAEFLSHNLNTDLPCSQVGGAMETVHYTAPSSVSHNGFLFKTASMSRANTEGKGREEFSRRWCTLSDGCFSYYESDKNSSPNGTLKAAEIVCLAIAAPEKHGYEHTFELYSDSERLYLFGTDDPESHKEWVKSIAKAFIPAAAEPLLRLGFQRIGRLKYKDGLNLQTPKVGWFALVGSTLHAYLEDSEGEEIHLRKLMELSIQQDTGVLVLVERGRMLYIEGEKKLDFSGWCAAIQSAAGSGGDTLSQQQLTNTDIPVIVHSCIAYITQCGLTSEGIYRKSGVNSRVAAMCEKFRRDARSVCLLEREHQVDDVSTTLKRFFREIGEVLFTSEAAGAWLSTINLKEDSMKISQYQLLLSRLPRVNKATLRALINHLYCVQRFSELNQMNLHNLAIVFGPTLFQTDGKDYTAGRVIEDLIEHYTLIFEVDEQQLKKQLDEITAIIQVRESRNTNYSTKVLANSGGSGDFICTVYLEQKTDMAEQHVKIPGAMTAAELTCEVLDRRNIPVKEKEYWSCWEVSEKEEMERPLHHQERVLPILHTLGTDSHLLIKKHLAMEAMKVYLASKVDVSRHGIMKFREERNILGLGSFHDRYFILNTSSLRMYKEIRSNRPERDWQVKNLKIYLGIKNKLRPPNSWGLTVVHESEKQEKPERQQWYLCCNSESDMTEWLATFLSIQYNGDIWPVDPVQQKRVTRVMPSDSRHGNVSLIPLRGSENEMRNSVAAFSQDPLALFRDVR